ncbi:Sua5/YciO/YrdC/YwlC family protein [Moraxella catarrhalis]|uniref:Sua5/YciO/YrdC/YwlC family protein n=1 Tax=Moraxella catarrhalis TaxID=480 RepID=UPI000E010B08|nr:Sua5/YciO/YrdC/YwlC family protein [Moraxella catarrhalis]STY80177.1 Putative translation factor (SUA5) [Moraxella catarrhalis]
MQKFYIHPDNPQKRVLMQAANLLKNDQLIIYPDPNGYRLAISLDAKQSLTQALRFGQYEPKFCLICRHISEISTFAKISDFAHRNLKNALNKNTHFLLNPTKSAPKKFVNSDDKNICVSLAHTPIVLGLIEALNAPFISMPIYPNGEKVTYDSTYELEMMMENLVDGFLDTGELQDQPSPVVSLIDAS